MSVLENQTRTKNKCHRKRPNESADDSPPAKAKRAALDNTAMNLEFAAFQHLRTLEVESIRKRPLSGYMEKVQDDINPAMRTSLVDWLVDVARELRLASDTLFLTVNYIDRFLSTRKVVGKKLELLGVSCMLVASKYEETGAPRLADFVRITDYVYTKLGLVRMESEVLKTLGFEMGNPTAKTFLRMFASWAAAQEENENPSRRFEFLCDYVAELSLTDYYGCVGCCVGNLRCTVDDAARISPVDTGTARAYGLRGIGIERVCPQTSQTHVHKRNIVRPSSSTQVHGP